MDIFVNKAGQRLGPFTQAEIDLALANGHLHPDDLAWQEGRKQWEPLAHFKSPQDTSQKKKVALDKSKAPEPQGWSGTALILATFTLLICLASISVIVFVQYQLHFAPRPEDESKKYAQFVFNKIVSHWSSRDLIDEVDATYLSEFNETKEKNLLQKLATLGSLTKVDSIDGINRANITRTGRIYTATYIIVATFQHGTAKFTFSVLLTQNGYWDLTKFQAESDVLKK